MRRCSLHQVAVVLIAAAGVACSASANSGFFVDAGPGTGGGNGNGSTGNGGSGNGNGMLGNGGNGSGDAGTSTVQVIYAHTDTELYSMDPTTHAVSDIGPFQVGGGTVDTITDLAVDGSGNVWVNTETQVYRAEVPATAGPVQLTLQTTIAAGKDQKFYALAFAPAGVLGSGEGLVAGDSNGELWYIDTSNASATPQDLGGFGSSPSGDTWELSGDLVFYTDSGQPTGLATIRSCTSKSCEKANDSLAAVDMSALAQAYASTTPGNLLKGTYGSGTGFGELFGLGAWGNAAYAFARDQSSAPAQLIQIDGTTGAGTSLQTFSSITSGWSGAGVTTKAAISVPQPVQ